MSTNYLFLPLKKKEKAVSPRFQHRSASGWVSYLAASLRLVMCELPVACNSSLHYEALHKAEIRCSIAMASRVQLAQVGTVPHMCVIVPLLCL